MAGAGPMPISVGSTPTAAHDTMRASGTRPRALAASPEARISAAAAVDDPAGIAGGDDAVLLEHRRQRRQPFERRLGPQVVVAIDGRDALAPLHLDGHDFLGHPPGRPGVVRALLAPQRIAVGLLRG